MSRRDKNVKEKLLEILAENAGKSVEELSGETRLVGDLGLSSFDLANIVVQIEDAFGLSIPDERFPELETIDDVLRIMEEVK